MITQVSRYLVRFLSKPTFSYRDTALMVSVATAFSSGMAHHIQQHLQAMQNLPSRQRRAISHDSKSFLIAAACGASVGFFYDRLVEVEQVKRTIHKVVTLDFSSWQLAVAAIITVVSGRFLAFRIKNLTSMSLNHYKIILGSFAIGGIAAIFAKKIKKKINKAEVISVSKATSLISFGQLRRDLALSIVGSSIALGAWQYQAIVARRVAAVGTAFLGCLFAYLIGPNHANGSSHGRANSSDDNNDGGPPSPSSGGGGGDGSSVSSSSGSGPTDDGHYLSAPPPSTTTTTTTTTTT